MVFNQILPLHQVTRSEERVLTTIPKGVEDGGHAKAWTTNPNMLNRGRLLSTLQGVGTNGTRQERRHAGDTLKRGQQTLSRIRVIPTPPVIQNRILLPCAFGEVAPHLREVIGGAGERPVLPARHIAV